MSQQSDTCSRGDLTLQWESAALDLRSRSWYECWKVILDHGLAAVLLALSAPVILLAMAAVKLTSRGPAIYTQERLGRHGRAFTIYKIRTMYDRCEDRSGPRWASPTGDPRVTPVGWFLRRTHVDELPQLWNVLRGEMSLVGPRPERAVFVDQLEKIVPHYRSRMLIRPGLTGLAQVQLPPDTELAGVQRKLAYDLYYIRHLGLWLDIRILLSTLGCVLGIPFAIPRALLQVPSGEAVEGAYRELTARVAPQMQPA